MDDVVGNTDENVREVIHFIRKGLGGYMFAMER